MMKLFIPLCLKSPRIYYLNISKIVTMFYYMYIEYEIYNLAYKTRKYIIYDSKLANSTMGKWYDDISFTEILRSQGH